MQKSETRLCRWTVFVAVAAAALLPSTGRAAAKPTDLKGKLVITGASTVAPLALEIAKRFESLHPDVRIEVQTGGSARGVADARQGLSDIGMVSRPLEPDEKDLLARPIAYDGIAVILHKSNPVKSLTDKQVVAIYTGQIKNWKDVGGKDAPITVVNKAEGRSTLDLFAHFYKLKHSAIKAHIIIGDNEQGIKTVAGNPNSIGYVSIGTAEYSATHGVPVKLLPLHSITAKVENVKNHTYPLARPLNLVTKTAPQGLARAYIEFAQSSAVDDLTKELYFVPPPRV